MTQLQAILDTLTTMQRRITNIELENLALKRHVEETTRIVGALEENIRTRAIATQVLANMPTEDTAFLDAVRLPEKKRGFFATKSPCRCPYLPGVDFPHTLPDCPHYGLRIGPVEL